VRHPGDAGGQQDGEAEVVGELAEEDQADVLRTEAAHEARELRRADRQPPEPAPPHDEPALSPDQVERHVAHQVAEDEDGEKGQEKAPSHAR
jgi:hypothetical protein